MKYKAVPGQGCSGTAFLSHEEPVLAALFFIPLWKICLLKVN